MHLIYTQWHHLSSVPSVDWWTMLIQPMAVTKCCPPDGSHPRWSPHTRPRQPKAHWWGLSPLWWIGPRNPLGPRHSPCPCCHSPLPPPSYPRSSHQESLTLAAGTFRIPLTTLYTGCGPPLWSLQRCLRCQAAGTWCGCSWWGQHHCPASCSRAHPWSTVSAGSPQIRLTHVTLPGMVCQPWQWQLLRGPGWRRYCSWTTAPHHPDRRGSHCGQLSPRSRAGGQQHGPLQWLGGGGHLLHVYQAWHLILCEAQGFASPGSQAEVSGFVKQLVGHAGSISVSARSGECRQRGLGLSLGTRAGRAAPRRVRTEFFR